MPPQDVSWPIKNDVLFDFATNRFRSETEENAYDDLGQKQTPTFVVFLFDGKFIKSYRPRERNPGLQENKPELGIGEGDFSGAHLNLYHYDALMFGHGSMPNTREIVSAGKLIVLPKLEFIVYHGQGVHKQRSCDILRTRAIGRSFEEWWVDPTRLSAVVRYTRYGNGKPFVDLEVDYDSITGSWLPSGWSYRQYHGSSSTIIYHVRTRVEERQLNLIVTSEDFDILEKKGMLVGKVTHRAATEEGTLREPTTKYYRAGEGGQRQEVLIAGGVERPASLSRRWLLALLLIPASLLTILVLLWRKRPSD